MVSEEGGRWDVAIKDNAVHLERRSEDDKTIFEELLDPPEARELARLLTKKADTVDANGGGDRDEDDSSDEDDSGGEDDSDEDDSSD